MKLMARSRGGGTGTHYEGLARIATRGLDKDVLGLPQVVVMTRRDGGGEPLARPEPPDEVLARRLAQADRRDVTALRAATEAAPVERAHVAIYEDTRGAGLKRKQG